MTAIKCQTCEGSGVVIIWRGKAIATCDDCQGSGENGSQAIPPADDPDVLEWVESVKRAIDPDPQPTDGNGSDPST